LTQAMFSSQGHAGGDKMNAPPPPPTQEDPLYSWLNDAQGSGKK